MDRHSLRLNRKYLVKELQEVDEVLSQVADLPEYVEMFTTKRVATEAAIILCDHYLEK